MYTAEDVSKDWLWACQGTGCGRVNGLVVGVSRTGCGRVNGLVVGVSRDWLWACQGTGCGRVKGLRYVPAVV